MSDLPDKFGDFAEVDKVTWLRVRLLQTEQALAAMTQRADRAEREVERLSAVIIDQARLYAGMTIPEDCAERDALRAQLATARREALEKIARLVHCVRDGNPHHVCNCSCRAIRALANEKEGNNG